MFSIIENIYYGWQYLISFSSNFISNFPAFLEMLSDSSHVFTSFFNDFSFPEWFTVTVFTIIGVSFFCKFFHWG